MATCPRCYGPLSDHHRCRPRWVRRAIRYSIITVSLALVGGLIQLALWPHHDVFLLGLLIGGTAGYVLAAVTGD